jgi:arylsulfatase A-like enzyme
MSLCKIFWAWIVLTLTAAWLPGPATAAPTASDRVNILFIAIDDLNDWVGFLRGHPQAKTPNMDRLAARGTVFANAHCAAPLCCPSRAAVFSGREPFNSGVYGNSDNISRVAPELVLLPTQMKAHGYRTWGAGKLLHRTRAELYDEFFKPEQRWSPFTSFKPLAYTPEELPSKATDNPRHVVDMGPGRPPVILPLNRMPSDRRPRDPGAESFDWGPLNVPDNAMGDTQIVDWAIERLSEKSAQPFFLAVGFYRPHIPLWAPAKYFEPFTNTPIKLPPFLENDLDDLGPVAREIAIGPATAGTHATVIKYNQWAPAVAAYLACVYFVDAQIGRLLDALEASEHGRNTAVIIWGDHGWHLGEKQHWGKWTGWERATRVPLLIVPPPGDRGRYAGGRLTREPVSLIDLYPTVLDMADVPPPSAGLDGKSLVPLLRDPNLATGRAVVSTFYGEHFSVGDDRWRYIRYADGSEELYDHRSDSNEWTNLAANPAHHAVKARLAGLLPKKPK